MDKVKITRELADAIKTVRTKGFYDNKNFEILEMATTQPKANSVMLEQHEVIYLFCHHDGINTLIQALANDFEVEETPEDKVREYYKDQIQRASSRDGTDHVSPAAIRKVLELLNIKIEGVNHD